MKTKVTGALLIGGLIGGAMAAFANREERQMKKQVKRQQRQMEQEIQQDLAVKISTVQQKVNNLTATSQALLPPLANDLEKQFAAFSFQTKPRITAIEKQLNKLKQILPTPVKK